MECVLLFTSVLFSGQYESRKHCSGEQYRRGLRWYQSQHKHLPNRAQQCSPDGRTNATHVCQNGQRPADHGATTACQHKYAVSKQSGKKSILLL